MAKCSVLILIRLNMEDPLFATATACLLEQRVRAMAIMNGPTETEAVISLFIMRKEKAEFLITTETLLTRLK